MLQDRETLLNQISVNTLRFRIKQWIDNFVANQKYVQGGRGVASLVAMLKDIPAVIVGSGPTLDRNIKDLVAVKDRALIIACDSSAKALLNFGVEPDLIVVTDSKERVADFIGGMEISKFNFIADTFIHPKTAEMLQDAKRLYWYSTLPIEACPFTGALNEWTGYIGNLGTGGCVATTAWWLAVRHFLSDPTLLVGLPEAFYEPSQMYSSEVMKTVETEPYNTHLVEAFDIFGKQCYTYPALQSFAFWFQDAFLQTPGIHINCSEGGILMENILNMPLVGVTNKYLSLQYDFDDVLFAKEHIVQKMIDQLPDDKKASADKYFNMLMVMIDGPSATNLGLRMGRTEMELVDDVNAVREAGFIVDETESATPPIEGVQPEVIKVLTLQGVGISKDDAPAIRYMIQRVEERPMLVEERQIDIDEKTNMVLQTMAQGLPQLPAQDIAKLTGIEEADVLNALEILCEQGLVEKEERVDADDLYVILSTMERVEIPTENIDAPRIMPPPKAPLKASPFTPSTIASRPDVTDEELSAAKRKWFPDRIGDGKVIEGEVIVGADGSTAPTAEVEEASPQEEGES